MTKAKTGEKPPTNKEKAALELSEAVNIVRNEIAEMESRLKQIADDSEYEPIPLEGETSEGFGVQIYVEAPLVVRILLDYEYPIYKVLGREFPQGMMDALAKMVGLQSIFYVDF